MTVIFYEGRGQAMIQAEGIAKEFSKSIRFLLADGETITIKRKDIISIENNEEDKKVNKYQIIRSIEDENKAVILNDTEGRFFQGYDFMGSVDWVDRIADATWMDVEEAGMIIKDLIAADEPAEPEKIVINTDDLMASLKTFLENIGCTNVTIGKLDEKQVAELRREATMNKAYHYTIESFGSDVPKNYEEILDWLNTKLDEILVYEYHFESSCGYVDYNKLSQDGREEVENLWDRYWAGQYKTAPVPKY